MTLKGKQNHYNVKFLKGYGFSIKVKDSKIVLTNTVDPFSKPEKEEWYISNMPYEKIVLSGKGYISTEALSLLSNNNKNVILLDTFGKPITFLNPARDSTTATLYRMTQYDTLPDEEAHASMIYFSEYAKFIPKRFGFSSRNQSFSGASKSNAKDIINALLNYGYAVLAGEISKFVNGVGLDAYYGFIHKNPLVIGNCLYDLIEPFRWMVDYAVFSLANSVSTKQRIYLKDYAHNREGDVVLDYSLTRRFLERLERVFQKERPYRLKHGRKRSDGLSMCQEITIVKITVQDLADYCCGYSKSFLEDNR